MHFTRSTAGTCRSDAGVTSAAASRRDPGRRKSSRYGSHPCRTRDGPCHAGRSEEGALDLDEPQARPAQASATCLPTHPIAVRGRAPIAPPGRRRIYSNRGFQVLGEHLAARAEMAFADYVRAAVCEPLELSLDPSGHPGAGMRASLDDVLALGASSLHRRSSRPRLTPRWSASSSRGSTACFPTSAASPRSTGGSASSSRARRTPRWSGTLTSPQTFGHFGGSGTFLWVDPVAGVACAALATREFGEWAKVAWPALSDAVLGELQSRDRQGT